MQFAGMWKGFKQVVENVQTRGGGQSYIRATYISGSGVLQDKSPFMCSYIFDINPPA